MNFGPIFSSQFSNCCFPQCRAARIPVPVVAGNRNIRKLSIRSRAAFCRFIVKLDVSRHISRKTRILGNPKLLRLTHHRARYVGTVACATWQDANLAQLFAQLARFGVAQSCRSYITRRVVHNGSELTDCSGQNRRKAFPKLTGHFFLSIAAFQPQLSNFLLRYRIRASFRHVGPQLTIKRRFKGLLFAEKVLQ